MQQTTRSLSRVTAPISEPVTLAEAKLYLRVDGSAEDALVSDLIVAARMDAEQWMCRSLVTQSWKLSISGDQDTQVKLPMGPVQAVLQVVTRASNGTTRTIAAEQYGLQGDMLRLHMLAAEETLEISYSAGYGHAGLVPRPIKLGLLAHIAALYDNRGAGMMVLGEQSQRLYAPYREVRL